MKKKNFLRIFPFVFTFFGLFFFESCTSNCPKDKNNFNKQYIEIINDVSTKKRTKNDSDWELIDKKMGRFIHECYPKFSSELDETEKLLFWENAMGYLYVRYGNDLLKKFGKTDRLILKIRDSLDSRQILIGPAVKRLCREWPVLYGHSERDISSQIKNTMEIRKKKKLFDTKKDSLD